MSSLAPPWSFSKVNILVHIWSYLFVFKAFQVKVINVLTQIEEVKISQKMQIQTQYVSETVFQAQEEGDEGEEEDYEDEEDHPHRD